MAEPEFAAAAEQAGARRRPVPPPDDQRDTVQFDPRDVAAAQPSAGPDFEDAPRVDASYAGPSSADASYAGGPSVDASFADASFADQAGAAPRGDLSADDGGRRDLEAEDDGPDYERASEAINAARSETPNQDAWRREPADEAAERARAEAAQAEEFDEADDDDPEDEPLPQAVQPTDAVRVARLDAEVLVVDGRPRYHVAECPSLVGRLAEPVPVSEAVELGFSPCGLCRPVDRLVAAASRR
nr:hypothetical protein [Actinoplanes ovalisporus]